MLVPVRMELVDCGCDIGYLLIIALAFWLFNDKNDVKPGVAYYLVIVHMISAVLW